MKFRLNPYFNGTCSKSKYTLTCLTKLTNSLNPYFNGTCSKSHSKLWKQKITTVLILILMEHAQRDLLIKATRKMEKLRLNPYFNGTCSKRW